ncbi:MAG: hypothetical protein HWE07_11645 [Cytophagia bacterium]|nr:hypothetical protein [Cytophagia bacterium]
MSKNSDIGSPENELVKKLESQFRNGNMKILRNSNNAVAEVFCVLKAEIIKFDLYYGENVVKDNLSLVTMILANFRNATLMWTDETPSFSELLELLKNSEFDISGIDEEIERIKFQVFELS